MYHGMFHGARFRVRVWVRQVVLTDEVFNRDCDGSRWRTWVPMVYITR